MCIDMNSGLIKGIMSSVCSVHIVKFCDGVYGLVVVAAAGGFCPLHGSLLTADNEKAVEHCAGQQELWSSVWEVGWTFSVQFSVYGFLERQELLHIEKQERFVGTRSPASTCECVSDEVDIPYPICICSLSY